MESELAKEAERLCACASFYFRRGSRFGSLYFLGTRGMKETAAGTKRPQPRGNSIPEKRTGRKEEREKTKVRLAKNDDEVSRRTLQAHAGTYNFF